MRVHLRRTRDSALPDLDSLGRTFADWFHEASGRTLALDLIYHDTLIDHTGPCASWELHAFLSDMLPVPTSRPVDDVAIIFCPSWKAGGLYGLMFDWDVATSPLGPFTANGIPRQGCAVFVGEHDSEQAMARTAIHELGHVFNLVHDLGGTSFMGSPPRAAGFTRDDGVRLSLAAAKNWYYAPGCANYWGEGVVDPPTLRRAAHLALRASVTRRKRLVGEPILLDLRLSAKRGRHRVYDRLDPGHAELRIWIETPRGERLLHAPRSRFCATEGRFTVAPRRGLRNNPRITLGSREGCLSEPGRYHLWAEYRPTPSSWVESNVVPVEVCLPSTGEENEISGLMTSAAVNRYLVDKGGPLPDDERRLLHDLLRRSTHPTLSYARYAAAWDALRTGRFEQAMEWFGSGKFGEGSLRGGAARLRRALAT